MKRSSKNAGKRKLEDRRLAKEVESHFPRGKLYNQLLQFEDNLDTLLRSKQLDINEALVLRTSKPSDTLRVAVYNTYSEQRPTYRLGDAEESTLTDPPSWTLKIEGYRASEENNRYSTRGRRTPFSEYLERIVVLLDKSEYPTDHTVEWDAKRYDGKFDGFEIKRAGEKETTVKILLYLRYVPSRYKLSDGLARLLDIHTDTKPAIITRLWQYVKLHKLQDATNCSLIRADDNLKKLFGRDTIEFQDLPKAVFRHLGPPDPVELEYTISTSGSSYEYQKCFDIIVDGDRPQQTQSKPPYHTKELDDLDHAMVGILKQLKDHARRKKFFEELSADPGTFLSKAMVSQIADYQVHYADKNANTPPFAKEEEERRAKYYYQPFSMRAAKKICGGQWY